MSIAFRLTARSSPFLRSKILLRPQPIQLPSSIRTVVTKGYTKAHEILVYDDSTSTGRLHITKHAAESLGDIVFVELPKVGRTVAQDDAIGAVESVKAASDIYAPVSGTVTAINNKLSDKPGLMSRDPEGEGWLCELKVDKPSELKELLDEEAYTKFCEEEE